MSSADDAEGLPTPRRYVAAAAVMAAILLAVLDGAIANVALPTIAGTLAVSPASSVWIVSGYQIAVVTALLPCAALGESVGLARVFTSGVVLFTAASAACALAPNLGLLVGARIVQGLGAAATMSMLAGLLRHTYPLRLLGTAIGFNAVVVGLSSAAGPSIGAAILAVAHWPWLFAVNIPVGALVLLAAPALPRVPGNGRRLDLVSMALNAGFFGPLVFGVDQLTDGPLLGAALIAAGLASLALLIRREAPRKAPLIPLDLLRRGSFRMSVIASVLIFAGQMLTFVGLPFYLQHGLGLTTVQTGLYLTSWPLTVAFAAPMAGRMADRVPSAWLCAAGGVLMAAGLVGAAAWPLAHDVRPLIAFMILGGLGFGLFQTPNNRNMLLSAPRERSGAAGGMQATARQFGQTTGSVLTAVLLTLVPTQAPRTALACAAGFALAAGLVSLLRVARASHPA